MVPGEVNGRRAAGSPLCQLWDRQILPGADVGCRIWDVDCGVQGMGIWGIGIWDIGYRGGMQDWATCCSSLQGGARELGSHTLGVKLHGAASGTGAHGGGDRAKHPLVMGV